jgi:hypothetical protein
MVFHMTVLFKKGARSDVGNYRGMSMAETLSKLYTSMLKKRLEGHYEAVVPEHCNGFRRGRGRTDSTFMLKETLRKRKAKGLDSCCVFYDFIKCFDKISRECTWKSMAVMGVDAKMIRAVKSTLENIECKMNVGGVEKTVKMKEGSGQGTTLGPTLCNFFFLPLLMQFEKKMSTVQTTATKMMEGEDDGEFSTFTHDFADDTCMLVAAREFNLYTKLFRSRVHVASEANPISKSVAVYIPAKLGGRQQHARTWVNAEETEWINYVHRSAYLGAYVTTDLKDEEEIRGRMQKALGMYGCLRKHSLASKDAWCSQEEGAHRNDLADYVGRRGIVGGLGNGDEGTEGRLQQDCPWVLSSLPLHDKKAQDYISKPPSEIGNRHAGTLPGLENTWARRSRDEDGGWTTA